MNLEHNFLKIILLTIVLLPTLPSLLIHPVLKEDGIYLINKRATKSKNISTALLVGLTEHANNLDLFHSLSVALDLVGVYALETGIALVNSSSMSYLADIEISFNSDQLLLFDDYLNPHKYTIVDESTWRNKPIVFRTWLQSRYRDIEVVFSSSQEYEQCDKALELRWVHSKGNFQLLSLESGGAVLSPSTSFTQYTKPGHLFCATNLSEQLNLFPISSVSKFYVVPLTTQKNALFVDMALEECPGSCKENVLDYLKLARASQMMVQPWALKRLSQAALFKTIFLPKKLLQLIKSEYEYNKAQSSAPESLVSTVFNQLESPTYYTPLSTEILDEVGQFILKSTSEWTGIDQSSLVITSVYGIREYRENAIINWHVDPVETQPLTAVIHISHGSDTKHCRADTASQDHEKSEVCSSGSDWGFNLAELEPGTNSQYNFAEYFLKEGEVIIFESARVPHARVERLRSDYYANIFVHMAPIDWLNYVEETL